GCPTGRASVVVHTPSVPARISGAAWLSHWLKVPATATRRAPGAYRTNRTSTESRIPLRACDSIPRPGTEGEGEGEGTVTRVKSRTTPAATASAPAHAAQGRTRRRNSTSRGALSHAHMRRAGDRA